MLKNDTRVNNHMLLLENKVGMAIAVAIVLLLVIFGIFMATKKRKETFKAENHLPTNPAAQ